MTTVALCSASGAPGVTTLACALGAVWPAERPVMVVEADPHGGALAARFGLHANIGVMSYLVGRRPDGGPVEVDEHLQRLPGGLEVLVGPAGSEPARVVDAEVATAPSLAEVSRDAVVDCGRLVLEAAGQRRLLAGADVVLAIVAGEPAAAAALAVASARLRSVAAGRLGIVVVGNDRSVGAQVASVVGLELAGQVPLDPRTAAVLRGEPGSARRLARAPLLRAAVRLARWTVELQSGHAGRPAWPAASTGSPSPVQPVPPDPAVDPQPHDRRIDGLPVDGPTVPTPAAWRSPVAPTVDGSGR